MLEYKEIEEISKKYYWKSNEQQLIDKSTRQPAVLSEEDMLKIKASLGLSLVINSRFRDLDDMAYKKNKKPDYDKNDVAKEVLTDIETTLHEACKRGKHEIARNSFPSSDLERYDKNGNLLPKDTHTMANYWLGFRDPNCSELYKSSLRYVFREHSRDAKNFNLKTLDKKGLSMDIEFDVTDFKRTKEVSKNMDSKLDKLKTEQPENTSRIEDVSLKPEEKARRMQFVEDLISTYDAVESQYDYEQRSSSHRLDASAVVKTIKENSFNGDITQGISGYTDYDEKGKQFTCYTIPELKKIAQMLKAAKTMSEKTGKNYLEDFLNQPDVNNLLLEMRQDKNGALRSLRGQAVQNRNANAIPQYPEVTCDDYDEIIGDASDVFMKKGQTMGITQAQAEIDRREESIGENEPVKKADKFKRGYMSEVGNGQSIGEDEPVSRAEKFKRGYMNEVGNGQSIGEDEPVSRAEKFKQRYMSEVGNGQSIGEDDPVKKSEKFKRGYISEERKKLLDNKKRSLDLQQQTCAFMVMADEEKDKKIQQPTKSIGMGRY